MGDVSPDPFYVLHAIPAKPYSYGSNQRILKELFQAFGEFVATWFFVFSGVGAVNSGFAVDWLRINNGQVTLEPGAKLTSPLVLMIAFAFGMGLMIMIFSFYRYTGGVLNPAVGWSLWLSGCMTTTAFIFYTIAEILGAIVGVGWAVALFPTQKPGVNEVAPGVQLWQALGMETLGTFMLCYVVLMMAAEHNHSRHLAPMVIGFTVFVCHLILIPFTGCSVNPARSFGSNVVSGIWTNAWVWWVGPWIGATSACFMFSIAKWVDYPALNGLQDDDNRTEGFIKALQRYYKYGEEGIRDPKMDIGFQVGAAKANISAGTHPAYLDKDEKNITPPVVITPSGPIVQTPLLNGQPVVQNVVPTTIVNPTITPQTIITPIAPGTGTPILNPGQSVVYLPQSQIPLQNITTVAK